jgi:hypothetical protein
LINIVFNLDDPFDGKKLAQENVEMI